jgi:hypothetical protein
MDAIDEMFDEAVEFLIANNQEVTLVNLIKASHYLTELYKFKHQDVIDVN